MLCICTRVDSDARQMSRAFCSVKSDSRKSRSWVCRTGCPRTIRSLIMDSVWSPKSHEDALTRSEVAKESTDSPGCCVSCQNWYRSYTMFLRGRQYALNLLTTVSKFFSSPSLSYVKVL